MERAAALDAARMTERAYSRLARLLSHDFREKKPVMLSIENEETDRGTFARITGLSPVRGRDRTKAEAEDNAA